MIKLGLFSLMGLYDRNTSPASVIQTTLDMVTMAEDLDFDIAWFAEHHFTNHSICRRSSRSAPIPRLSRAPPVAATRPS